MKSQDEFYLGLHLQLVRCDPLKLSSVKNLNRDVATLKSRVSNEGLAFLTKTLPSLGKALDRGLVSGRFKRPLSFGKGKSPNMPAFMQVYFNLVFDEDSLLRDVVPAEAISHLRQVLYFAYKLELPYSAKENDRVIDTFISTEKELELLDIPLANDILALAKIITRKVFHGFNHKDIHPRHGPGAVATGEKLDAKWYFTRRYRTIESVYEFARYFLTDFRSTMFDRFLHVPTITHFNGQSKVVLVPKDSRGPRLISCEPLEFQWIQQGLGRKLANHLEYVSTYTRGKVNFTRQEINSGLAKTSSASQCYATIDLKDASDRVSLQLVSRIFADLPILLGALEACRTTETKLPDGRIVSLLKFAPMGSALCFPVEAFIFWVVIVSAIVDRTQLPLELAGDSVYVYGDDIIVPTKYAELSIQALESVGLLVNRDKSCTEGFFRESCGVDAFKGTDVTPLRLKSPWTDRKTDGSAYVAYLHLRNALALRGYVGSSEFLDMELQKLYGNIPYGTSVAPYPCKLVNSPLQAEVLNRPLFRRRFNRDYQRVEFLLPSLSSRKVKSKLDGWQRLMRNFVSPPFSDPSVIVVPRSIQIKRGWAAVF